jgi:alkylation response protein AidB-like acyl-CoA dehydrogenase
MTVEHKLFGEQLRRAFDSHAPLSETRRCIEAAKHSAAAWSVLKESGVLGANVSERHGGSGLGALPVCVAAEEIGWAAASVPALSTLYLFPEFLRVCEGKPACIDLLNSSPAGDAGVAVSIFRPQEVIFGNGRLNGIARPVANALEAKSALLLVQTDKAPAVILVELDQAGVIRKRLDVIDPSRPMAELRFDSVDAFQVGTLEQAQDTILRAAIYLAFEQVGGAERALKSAVDYAKERYAFDRPIGSYQAIKHKLADVWTHIQIARAHALYGAWALETNSTDLPLAAASARVAACDAYRLAAQECLQVHGGFGFTFEADCHLFYRRSRALAAALGSARSWREKLVGLIEAGATPVH